MVYKVVQQSAVLKPTATLGVVTSGPRVSVSRLGSEHFITAPVGQSFHIYDADDLQLQYLSRPLLGNISSCLSIGEITLVSVGVRILAFHKMVLLATLEGHTEDVKLLSNIGDSFLVSSSKSESLVWKLPNLTRHSHAIQDPLKPFAEIKTAYEISSMVHIPTYTNKMLIGGVNGELELWNINTGRKIYEFSSHKKSIGVTCISASPAIDVAGIGYMDGTLQVVNLKSDEVLMTLSQIEHGSVTSLAFRSDYSDGMLVSGTSSGDLVVWDLTKRAIHSFVKNVHSNGVGSLCFLDTLPLLISSGLSDNAISVHIFDKPDGGCRLLKERRGFTTDLAFILPYGEHDMIVAGDNGEVGRLNLIQAQQNKVWSQSSLSCQTSGKNSLMPWKFRNLAHLPKVVSIGYTGESRMRHFDWPCVVTAHEGLADAYVWSAHQQALVTRMLSVPRKQSTGSKHPIITAVAVSPCGNYAVIGCENGELHRFNLQSCYYRGEVGKLALSVEKITFLSSREILVADRSAIHQYRVVPRPELVKTIACVSNIKTFAVHGFMCAVAHEDGQVSIIDMHSDRKARTIVEMAETDITALCWSRGGRWLAIASNMNKMIIYDVPTACVIDRIEFSCACVGIEFTLNNAQIVTCHAGGKGAIRVWQNIALLEEPGIVGQDAFKIDEEPRQVVERDHVAVKRRRVMADDKGEMTLSIGSRTRWQQILKLDEIKERNKPSKAPEKPKSAPFFLPVKYKGVEPVFVAPETPEEEVDSETMKNEPAFHSNSQFIQLLMGEKFDKVREHLVSLEPAGVHLCIQELEDTDEGIKKFIDFLTRETRIARNLDLKATWTSLFLNQYGSSHLRSANLADLNAACANAHSKFNTRTNELQCLLKVAAALQLHR